MQSECVDCDKPASSYWGTLAYCGIHLSIVMREQPKAHRCIRCEEVQPTNVSWHRTHECRKCQESRGRRGEE
jgi:hypothetical protein